MWLNKEILPYLCFGCDSCKGTDKELTVWHVKRDVRFAIYFTMPNKRVLFVGWDEQDISKSLNWQSVEEFLDNTYKDRTRVYSYQEYLTVTNSKFI